MFVVGPRRVFLPGKTNVHWFSMPDGRLSLVTIGCVDQQQTLVKAITFQLVTQSTSEETENDYRLYAFLTVWQFWMELAEAENRGPPIRVRDSGERSR